jgi:hypothetical protein
MTETMPPGQLAREALTAMQRNEMFALLVQHFDGVSQDQFERDLAEKNWVVEIRNDGRLQGFSTLLVCEQCDGDRAITAIYSGDTIVSPEAWRSPALARAWIAAVNHIRAEHPQRPCHWLLLTSGFRTYRFLPVFWREFFPRHDAVTPPRTQQLLDRLAWNRYGELYDRVKGIVRFPQPQRLRHTFPSGRATDSHVAYFLERNPGYDEGDELVCIAEISEENLTSAGWRMIAR